MQRRDSILAILQDSGVAISTLETLLDGARDLVQEHRGLQLQEISSNRMLCYVCDTSIRWGDHEIGCPIPKICDAIIYLDSELGR